MRLKTNNSLQDTAAANIRLITGLPVRQQQAFAGKKKGGIEDTEVWIQVHQGDENDKMMRDVPSFRDEDELKLARRRPQCLYGS